MADERRQQRPSRDGDGRRGGSGGAGGSRGRSDSRGDARKDSRGGDSRSDGRSGARGDGRSAGRSDSRGGRGDNRSGGREFSRGGDSRPRRDPASRTADQAAYDGPDLPEDITGAELDRAIAAQLKSLPEKLANRVARHLVAATRVLEDDPETAYQHARAARARAPRLAVVREAAGESAYAAGHYAEALAELRAGKRINGATAYLPIMADCHRALGHPDQALRLSKSPSVANFAPAAKAEMTIVEAGARRDLGQSDAALRTLELAPLLSKSREPWVVRLRYAYADALAEAGRINDAVTWFHRADAIDAEELTDAAERAEALQAQLES